ncbi:hypothetical protein DRQ26_00080 [bacterium]|nr:MAG: hypothetical protein DRQ26_00080 [bacterium]
MPLDREKYLELFLSEVDEQLTQLNNLLVSLEGIGADEKTIAEIFRITHTIKGNAAAMGYDVVSEFAHRIEDVFDLLRSGKLDFSQDVANAVFFALDELQKMLMELRKNKVEPEELPEVEKILKKIAMGEGNWESELGKMRMEREAPISDVARVPMRKLDSLINLIGEMLINISKLEMMNVRIGSRNLKDTISHLRRIVSDFQYIIMDIRLVPLASIFDQLPRMVRDIAQQEEKEVELSISGEDIQLDSRVVEKIKTPIIQILRNAISHGIENPAKRRELGKESKGLIKISAVREMGMVKIAISDDGAGIDVSKIKKTALALKIATEERLSQMSDEEILNLIFEPGFTTASGTTKISGRGVGMDAVRSELTSIGGTIVVKSKVGVGTTFEIFAPISIAIIKSLLCEVGGNVYAFPITTVEAIRKFLPSEIRRMNGENFFRFEGELVPLLDVGNVLYDKNPDYHSKDDVNVIITNVANKLFGFSVDELLREEDLVVKPLDVLSDVKTVSGASLLGSGDVVLILDISEMVRKASLERMVI